MACPYCESRTNDFITINQTVEYSNIEISVNKQGMLRIRVFDSNGDLITQDIDAIREAVYLAYKRT